MATTASIRERHALAVALLRIRSSHCDTVEEVERAAEALADVSA